jgi:hypothetical protein
VRRYKRKIRKRRRKVDIQLLLRIFGLMVGIMGWLIFLKLKEPNPIIPDPVLIPFVPLPADPAIRYIHPPVARWFKQHYPPDKEGIA